MYKILEKERLNPFVSKITVADEKIAKKAKPGQFVILQVDETGERIPLTIADFDRINGTISIIFQIVGTTTKKLDNLKVGEKLYSLVGPLGKETEMDALGCGSVDSMTLTGFKEINCISADATFFPIIIMVKIATS